MFEDNRGEEDQVNQHQESDTTQGPSEECDCRDRNYRQQTLKRNHLICPDRS